MMTARDILGKRFEFSNRWTGDAPDFIVVSIDPAADDCYVRPVASPPQHLSLAKVMDAINKGNLRESALPPHSQQTQA
jgi:hypothetical protein